jgi:hypothetical protein
MSAHAAVCVWIDIMFLKDPWMSKQGTAGRRNHRTLTILQKLEVIRRLESGKNHIEFMFWYSTGL